MEEIIRINLLCLWKEFRRIRDRIQIGPQRLKRRESEHNSDISVKTAASRFAFLKAHLLS